MVTVQPSSVFVGGSAVAFAGGVVVAVVGFPVLAGAVVRGRSLVGDAVEGDSGAAADVTEGNGAGKVSDLAAGSCARARSFGSEVRSTGRMATLASTMLVAVAAAQPASGANPEDRTRQ